MKFRCAVTVREVAPQGLVLESRPGTGRLVLAALLFVVAFACLGTALRQHVGGTPLVQVTPYAIGAILAGQQALAALGRALALMQRLTFDRGLGELRLESLDPRRNASANYPLPQLLKVHLNRVDDGTFDPDTLLFIFRGGGAIQFPPAPGRAKELEGIAARLGRYLGIPRAGREKVAAPTQRLRPEAGRKAPRESQEA